MTSTAGGAATDPLRHLPTPAWAVDVILPELPLMGLIVDAGCGAGAILARVAIAANPRAHIWGVEYQDYLADEARARCVEIRATGRLGLVDAVQADFLTWDPPNPVTCVISNPPFSRAEEFARRAIELTSPHNGTVAILQRLDWLGSKEREGFLDANKPDAHILDRRPQFRVGADGKKGSDSCEYAWMLFGPGLGGRWMRLRCPPADRRRRLPGALPAEMATGELAT
jgi:SAM-dependent methyltransferase